MASQFSDKTFEYFKKARKNKNNRPWFEKNRALYDEHVFEPFSLLVQKIAVEFGSELPRIDISTKKIVKPIRRNFDKEIGLIRSNSAVFLSEKPTSLFEGNPGVYISIGEGSEDNIFGLGLYMVSSRQMSLLRDGISRDFDELHLILSDPLLKKRLGGLSGDVYKRFPKGFDESAQYAKYMKHKQFFLSTELSEKNILSKSYQSNMLKNIEAGLPFLKWLRNAVGTYKGRTSRNIE